MSIERKRLSDYVDMCLDGDRIVESEIIFVDKVVPITICEKKYGPLLELFSVMKRCFYPQEEKVARFYLGIPEDLTAEDIENGKEFELGFIRTLRETAEKFNLTVEEVRIITEYKLSKWYHFRGSRSKKWLEYLD